MIIANKNFPLLGPSRPALLGTLAALIFAATCVAAPGTPVVTGIATNASGPGGFIFDGTSMWVTDAVQGLCKIVPGGTGKLSNCILPPTSNTTVHAVLGQPAYDPIGLFVYLPDMSITSRGIWRYHFNVNAGTFNNNLADPGVNIAPAVAPAVGLGPQQPVAVALGDDGSLYASMSANKNSSLVRITTPSAATQTAVVMAKATLSGSPARALAFVGTALWYADPAGEVLVPGASTCAAKCSGTLNTQVGVPNPLSMAWDAVNSMVYIGTASGVFQHNRLNGQTVLYSNHWVSGLNKGLLTDVTAVGVDATGNLYYADDPSGSQLPSATVYSVAGNLTPDGQGNLPSPPPTIPPTELATPPFANPALLYSTGVTAPKGAVYMGAHVWVVDGALGFCKVDPTLPAPSLTACVPTGATGVPSLPLGFVPGSPAYDKVNHIAYLPDTTPTGAGIWKLTFNPATETVTAAASYMVNTTTVKGAASLTAAATLATTATAPTALAWGPDGSLYAAMAATTQILRVTPAAVAPKPKVAFIGTMFEAGAVSLAFLNSDLYDVEKQNSSVLYGATTCTGNCSSLFLAVVMILPTSVGSDGTNVYFGDGQKLMIFDPVANTFANMADTGLVNGVATPFANLTAITSDGLGHIFAADAGHMWEIAGSGAVPSITSMAPFQAPESSTKAVTITGSNFLPTSLVVSTCPAITPGSVAVVSLTQITATFAVNPVGPLGACNVTVTTPSGASAASAGSSFTVLIGPPAVISIITTPATVPPSGFRGRTIPVSIAGANMGSGAIDLIPGITITGSVVNAAGTLLTANFVISPTATLGPQNVTVSTPSGPSNIMTFTIAAAPPVLSTIAPPQGVAGSTVTLNLTGTDLFGATMNPPAGFIISGTPTVTATSINVTFIVTSTVPAGPQIITVTGPGGTSNALTFKIVPALTSIAAVSARAGATTPVTLSGTSLAGVTSVNAGANIQVTGVVATAGTVTATFASALNAPLGAQSVTVTDVNGTSNAVTFTLTAPVPVLNSIAPLTVGTGATVPITLTGTGLVGGTLTLPTGITLSGTPVTSFGTITATIVVAGNATLGAQNITVTTPGGTSLPVSVTVFALAPLLNTIAPNTAAAGTLTTPNTPTITLTGQGFTGTTAVNVAVGGGISVTSFTVVSNTQLTATLSILSNAITQAISVTNPNGTSNAVTFGIVPTLSSISPTSQPANLSGANLSVLVTLTGTSLTGATSINAGTGIVVTGLTVVSSTQITANFAIANTAVQGNRNITVTTPGGTTGAVVFNVLPPPPAITSLNVPLKRGSPQGVTLGGTSLTGANSITAIQVLLNGTAIPTTTWAVSGFATGASQLRWNWTMPSTLPVTSGTQVYTMTVTTPSGTSAPFTFAVQ